MQSILSDTSTTRKKKMAVKISIESAKKLGIFRIEYDSAGKKRIVAKKSQNSKEKTIIRKGEKIELKNRANVYYFTAEDIE